MPRSPALLRSPAPLALLLLPLVLGQCAGGEHVALGLTARDRVALTATASEIVTDLPVAEGSPVTAGTVLVRLDDRQQRASVDLAQAELARARAAFDKLRAGARAEEIAAARADVDGARADLLQAERSYDRNSTLLRSDTVAAARLDLDLAQRDQARAALAKAEAVLEQLQNGTRPEDLAIAEADVNAAAARLAAETGKLDDLTIRASRDGKLDSLPWHRGERVTAGSPVAVLLAADAVLARAYLPEPYRATLAPGQALTVRVDGRAAPLTGTVRWISADPAFTPYYALNQTERSRLMYLMELTLPPEADDLPVGVPLQVVLP